jgi:hypothetical protein
MTLLGIQEDPIRVFKEGIPAVGRKLDQTSVEHKLSVYALQKKKSS